MSETESQYDVSYIAVGANELHEGDYVTLRESADLGCVQKAQRLLTEPARIVRCLDSNVVQVMFNDGQRMTLNGLCLKKVTTYNSSESSNVRRFREIANEMTQTYKAKNADYGNAYEDGYKMFGHTQLLSRIYEKFLRVKNLLDGHTPQVDEKVTDTLTDLANQAIILRMIA